MANSHTIEGKWNDLRGAVKERWGDLTDSELDRIAGHRDRLMGMLQEKYGYSAQRAADEIDHLANRYNSTIEGRAEDVFGDMTQYVERYPWVAIVATFVLGLFLGMFLKPSR